MTLEQFQQADKLISKIKELESFKKAFNNGYINYIKAETEKEAEWLYVRTGDEVHTLINDYIGKRLKELKTELENL